MSEMRVEDKLLSDLVVYRTYAKYLPDQLRRESLTEGINRSMHMHMDRFPALTDSIFDAFQLVHRKVIMPSMRGLQFGGSGVIRNNIRQYNCSFHPVDRVEAFAETLYLLLCGTGVGYSVQSHHVNQLPKVHKPLEIMYYPIHDSIEGWAMALNTLVEAYFFRKPLPQFDYFQIRAEGTLLKTTGGRAPGPEKLQKTLELIQKRLEECVGRRLKPIDAHDLMCIIADCVRAGGIREAALIALFDRYDTEMLRCKSGNWWEDHPYRGRANNSAVLPRDEVSYEEFAEIYNVLQSNRSGEPGFYWTNNREWGANPCVEIALRPQQFCNLTTVNQASIQSITQLLEYTSAASFIGTLQASYTDFPFLHGQWRATTEQEALIGVSFTGIADTGNRFSAAELRSAAQAVVERNRATARKIGINVAARTTTGKPEGSSSATLATSSGIHARRGSADRTYLRRVRLKDNTPLVQFLLEQVPGLMEKSERDDNIIITIPQMAPERALMYHDEKALDTFHRAMLYNKHWIAPGHVYGDNQNNMSCTIDVRDHEWNDLKIEMWENRNIYNGLSIFPYDGGTYVQAPFEACDRATYDRYMKMVKPLDFTQIVEYVDTTEQQAQNACGGGSCEIM